MQRLFIKILSISILLFSACSKNDSNPPAPNNLSNGNEISYFTIENDTFGGISEYKPDKLYTVFKTLYPSASNPPTPCDGHIDVNSHSIKYQEIKIIDTIKANSLASFMLHVGSESDYFKLKGDYEISNNDIVNEKKHGSCINYNTCGQPNNPNYIHESGNFLYGAIKMKNSYYYIYSGTYTITNYNTPLKASFNGKAYKCKDLSLLSPTTSPRVNFELNYNYSNFDTLTSYIVTANFK